MKTTDKILCTFFSLQNEKCSIVIQVFQVETETSGSHPKENEMGLNYRWVLMTLHALHQHSFDDLQIMLLLISKNARKVPKVKTINRYSFRSRVSKSWRRDQSHSPS